MKLLSQQYLASHKIDPKLYHLNDYGFEEYEVQEVHQNEVTVKGINRTVGWSRVLTFRLLKENGEVRIEPSGTSEHTGHQGKPYYSITAWWTAGEKIKE